MRFLNIISSLNPQIRPVNVKPSWFSHTQLKLLGSAINGDNEGERIQSLENIYYNECFICFSTFQKPVAIDRAAVALLPFSSCFALICVMCMTVCRFYENANEMDFGRIIEIQLNSLWLFQWHSLNFPTISN